MSLPCLSRSDQSCSSFCVLRTFFRLFDAKIVSHMVSWLYFLVSSFAFCFDFCVLYSLFIVAVSTSSRPCVIRARVDDAILDFNGLLNALATIYALCWIMSAMISLTVSTSSRSCSVESASQFELELLILFFWYLLLMVSWSSMLSFPPLRPV